MSLPFIHFDTAKIQIISENRGKKQIKISKNPPKTKNTGKFIMIYSKNRGITLYIKSLMEFDI